jgi:hypothetical protein
MSLSLAPQTTTATAAICPNYVLDVGMGKVGVKYMPCVLRFGVAPYAPVRVCTCMPTCTCMLEGGDIKYQIKREDRCHGLEKKNVFLAL